MKCPKCGQEMIDIKDYCVNCGAKLKKESKGLKTSTLVLIFIIIIILSILFCYLIANYNTDKELEPFIDKSNIKRSY